MTVGLGVSDASSSYGPLPSSGQTISGTSSNSMPATTVTASSSDPGTVSYPGNLEYPDDVSAATPTGADSLVQRNSRVERCEQC